jgi:ribosomal protein S18 acetylase RimI-like enzyme
MLRHVVVVVKSRKPLNVREPTGLSPFGPASAEPMKSVWSTWPKADTESRVCPKAGADKASSATTRATARPKLSGAVRVEEATTVSADLTAAIGRLVGQLSSSATAPTEDELREIVDSPATRLLVARDDDDEAIIGSLTLVLFRIPTGVRAWIEDVVVDKQARRHGVGEALNREALRLAGEAGARSVDLTSRPSREAANRLYRRLGFEERETTVYRFRGR